MFAGYVPGQYKVNNVYIIDLQSLVSPRLIPKSQDDLISHTTNASCSMLVPHG